MSDSLVRVIVNRGEIFELVTKAGHAWTTFNKMKDHYRQQIMFLEGCFTISEAEKIIEMWQQGRSYGRDEGEDIARDEIKRVLHL